VPNLAAIKRASGWLEPGACQRLHDLAAEVPADQAIVEIGGYRGKSTGWLALGSSEGNGAPVFTVDTWDTRSIDTWPEDHPAYVEKYADPQVRADYDAHLSAAGIDEIVTPIVGWSTDVAKAWKKDGHPKVGLLFHDGSHYHDDVVADLKAWLPLMAPDAVVILHDAGNPTTGVLSAADEVFKTRRKWDWAGRELAPWIHNGNDTLKRGTLTVRTKAKA
jgi:predicted O-methyltransferase YrrM